MLFTPTRDTPSEEAAGEDGYLMQEIISPFKQLRIQKNPIVTVNDDAMSSPAQALEL